MSAKYIAKCIQRTSCKHFRRKFMEFCLIYSIKEIVKLCWQELQTLNYLEIKGRKQYF